MTRKRLTKFEFASLFLAQQGKCGCGCKQKLEAGKVDEEHTILHYFRDGADPGYDGKPDSLWRRDCHKIKTKSDLAMIAKADRQKRHHETGRSSGARQWRKIRGRGFDKAMRKKMDGSVIRND